MSVPIKFKPSVQKIYFPLPHPMSPIKDYFGIDSRNSYTLGQAL